MKLFAGLDSDARCDRAVGDTPAPGAFVHPTARLEHGATLDPGAAFLIEHANITA